MSKRAAEDRHTTCELAGVDTNSFVEFTRKCVKNYDNGGKASMLKAAIYLYAGLKSTDADSNFMSSPDGYADDSDLLDGVSEL